MNVLRDIKICLNPVSGVLGGCFKETLCKFGGGLKVFVFRQLFEMFEESYKGVLREYFKNVSRVVQQLFDTF